MILTMAQAAYKPSPRPISLLVVDDHSAEVDMLCRWLSNQPNIELVGRCRCGAEALSLLKFSAPDLILLDVFAPGSEGPTMAARVRAASPQTKIMLMSAFALQAHPRFLGNDFDVFLRKDDLLAEFSQLLDRWCGQGGADGG